MLRRQSVITVAMLLLTWFLITGAAGIFLTATGIRINTTKSLPLGLYRIDQTTLEIERGSLVAACPDLSNQAIRLAQQRGYLAAGWGCEGSVAPFLKRVLALPGDLVEITEEGIQVNGEKIENSARLVDDIAGRPMPPLPASGEVPPEHFWLFSDYAPDSFDSRYFGPVAHAAIIGTAVPLGRHSR